MKERTSEFLFKLLLVTAILVFPLYPTSIACSPILEEDLNGYFPGARSHGMGNVGISIPNDPFTSFYNPAALCLLTNTYIGIDLINQSDGSNNDHSNLPGIAGFSMDFVTFARSSGGVTWRPLQRRIEEKTTILFSDESQETVTVESKLEYRTDEFYLTLTTLTSESLDDLSGKPLVGLNLKYYRAYLAESEVTKNHTYVDATSNFDTGNGFGIDFGFIYLRKPLLFGFAVKDIFSKIYWTEYESDRIQTKTGIGISTFLFEQWTIYTDLRYDSGLRKGGFYSGIEFTPTKKGKNKRVLSTRQLQNKNKSLNGGSFRLGASIKDIKKGNDITYSLGFSYTFSLFCFELALSGDQNLLNSKKFSSQASIFVIH